MILGKNLIVSINGTAIAGAKSCQFQISQEFLKVCSPTEGRTFGKVPTTYDWSMSVDCLIPNSILSISLVNRLIAGTRVLLTFTDGSGQNRAGFAYVKSCDESGSIGSIAKFSASFEADGELYKYETISLQRFTEGNDKIIVFNNDGRIIISNQTQGDNIKIQEKYIFAGSKLYIFDCSVNWFVSTDTLSHVKSYISNEDGQSLNEYAIAKGYGDMLIEITSSQPYVVAANDDDTFHIIILRP